MINDYHQLLIEAHDAGTSASAGLRSHMTKLLQLGAPASLIATLVEAIAALEKSGEFVSESLNPPAIGMRDFDRKDIEEAIAEVLCDENAR